MMVANFQLYYIFKYEYFIYTFLTFAYVSKNGAHIVGVIFFIC